MPAATPDAASPDAGAPDADAPAPACAPVWLDADERSTWLVLSAMLMKFPAALDAQLTRDSGLTFFEYMVLAVLSERPDHTARMSELAALANGSLSRLSHVARRLERRGLMRRQPDQVDGRFTEALLTETGRDALVAAAPGHVRAVRDLVFTGLDPGHREALRQACRTILGSVDPAALETLTAMQAHGPEDSTG